MQKTQIDQIDQHFKSGRTLTSLQAIHKFNCTRLAAVVEKLKRLRGRPIKTEMIITKESSKRIAKYRQVK